MTERDFSPGDRVILTDDGAAATVRWSKDGYSPVDRTDQDPEEFGGSVVANDRLKLDSDSTVSLSVHGCLRD